MKKPAQYYVDLIILAIILIVINLISNSIYSYYDLTEDKRFTLSNSTKKLLHETSDNIFVTVYLDGTFPASLKRFRDRVQDILDEFHKENAYLDYDFIDPLDGSPDDVRQMEKSLVDKRLYPTTINYFDGTENVMKPIFPYAIFKYGNKEVVVNLFELEGITNYDDKTLHESEAQLEYRFANAIQKLQMEERPLIVFTEGNGEVTTTQLGGLFNELKKYYNPVRLNLDSTYVLNDKVKLLIIPAPETVISDRNKFLIDQYIMQGGKVIWLVERMDIRLDSVATSQAYIPPLLNVGLDNLFFKYGFKVLDNTILDIECSKIPQVVGSAAGKPQMQLFPYFYHPLITSSSEHPIVKNIDRVNMAFPSTIDTVMTSTPIKKTFLLSSSKYSRFQMAPLNLNFKMMGIKPDVSKFNKSYQPVALLLEGQFESYYKNRLTKEQHEALKGVGGEFVELSSPTSMLVISDVDFVKNLYNISNNKITRIGYNKWERTTYAGNKEFILNAIEYMLDVRGLLESRAKEFKLRLLSEAELQNRTQFWQTLNIAFPLVLLIVFGLMFNFIRKWRYAR